MDKLIDVKPFANLKETDLAWAAGIVDGEGCITITEAKPAKQYKSPRYNLVLIVTNTHEPTVQRLLTMFGIGSIYRDSRSKISAAVSDAFRWTVSRKQAGWVIEAIRPYLFTKATDADVALEFVYLDGAAIPKIGVPDWLNARRAELRNKIRIGKPQRTGPRKGTHFT